MYSPLGRNKVQSPVQELSDRLSQLENAINAAREAYVEALKTPPPPAGGDSNPKTPTSSSKVAGSLRSFFRRRTSSSNTPQKDDSKELKTPPPPQSPPPAPPTSTQTDTNDSNQEATDATNASEADVDDKNKTVQDTNKDNNNTSRLKSQKVSKEREARFVVDLSDPDTFVENLRRVAELVVVGENFVTSQQKREEEAFRRSQEKWKHKRDELDLGITGSEEDADDKSPEPEEFIQYKDEYMQLFDLFFERSALEIIINLITGATFRLRPDEKEEIRKIYAHEEKDGDSAAAAPAENDDAGSSRGGTDQQKMQPNTKIPSSTIASLEDRVTILPPFQIATQALQSVSILIQNVSRVSSLYLLLSNNLINELINLPLDLYLVAERRRQLLDSGQQQLQRGRSNHRQSESSSSITMTFNSPEISELTTHFVTFLKSLAMRMNAQTLQFFLKYSTEIAGETASSSHFSSSATSNAPSRDDEDDEADHNHEGSAVAPKAPMNKRLNVEFPLYERALEFCAAHQDSFVRITAMNICLNTLRLTTVSPPDEVDSTTEQQEKEKEKEAELLSCSLGSSPDGVLHNARPLPFRERLAIAQYTCIPSRVERLISPIFTKLAERWNSLDEQIREIDRNKGSIVATEAAVRAQEKNRRQRLLNTFKERAANLQDELLILDDVFKVGLTVLNEQLIEMMLATFVYPLLLQPLLLYCHRLSAALEMPVHTFSEHPLGGHNGDFAEAEKSLAAVAGPAKTALFSIAAVFDFLSNQPLLRLVGAALLHPLSPDSSGVPTLRSTLEVASRSANGRKIIRLDRQTKHMHGDRSTYSFGTIPGNRRVSRTKLDLTAIQDEDEACVFVLSPALADVLEFRGDDESLLARTRPNQYRRALFKFLDAPADISDVRGLAFHALDAAVTALDSKFAADVLFGVDLKGFSKPTDGFVADSDAADNDDQAVDAVDGESSLKPRVFSENPTSSDLIGEVIPPLCLCVLHASKQPLRSAEWKIEYDEVAAHALLSSVRDNERALSTAIASTEKLWWKAAAFLSSIPGKIPSPMGAVMGGLSIPMRGAPSINDPKYDFHIEGMLMNFIFYEKMDELDELPTVETFVKLTARNDGIEGLSVSITTQSAFESLCGRIGKFLIEQADEASVPLSEKEEVQCTRSDARALIKLDALLQLLKNMASTNGTILETVDNLAGVAVTSDGTIIDTSDSFHPKVLKQIYAPLSSRFSKFLFNSSVLANSAQTGSTIDLAGKQLLPCVCEAPASLSHLFAASSSGVVSEGVTWESLYLVLSGRFLIIAQPQIGERSSEGRVITCCPLERLFVEQDVPDQEDNGPPARRMMLFHNWFDTTPPTFLTFSTTPMYERYGAFDRVKSFTSTLDIWFEDQSTADHALLVMSNQIFLAKSDRGHRVTNFLAHEHDGK